MPESFRCVPRKRGTRERKLVCGSVVSAFPIRLRPMRDKWRPLRGGAPLPIPNREVKPRRDDDTARKRGKVVRRPPLREARTMLYGLSCFLWLLSHSISFFYTHRFSLPTFYYFYSQIPRYGQEIGFCFYLTNYQCFRIFTKS